jgi:hypothetical protein
MRNLAGVKEADQFIREELALAGIRSLRLPNEEGKHPEVPRTVFGFLGGKAFFGELAQFDEERTESYLGLVNFQVLQSCAEFRFARQWSYYIATGYVPMEVAIELYEHPIDRKDVRVQGHCGCPDPREYRPVQNGPLIAGMRCVDCYHIDSQEGLNLFVETLRRHRLFEE